MPGTGLLKEYMVKSGQIKQSDLGGEQQTPFEQAFANLAHTYLKDVAPKLMNFEVGFQLIEKNKENTKAVGVFGFKVGSQWLYAPVFFLNGDLKGHELLFIKSQDMFVPMKEEWINWLVGRKPSMLGGSINRNLSQIGVMPPNLYQLSRSPHKFASYMPKIASWVKNSGMLHNLADWATTDLTKDERFKDIKTFSEFLKQASRPVFEYLMKIASKHVWLIPAIDKFYGNNFLDEVIEGIKTREKSANSKSILKKLSNHLGCRGAMGSGKKSFKKLKSVFDKFKKPEKTASKLEIYTYDQIKVKGGPDLIHNLSEDEREKLIKERVVIRDKRDKDEVTIAFNVQTELRLRNPDRTGIYEVLVKPDDFQKCLVLFGPYSHTGRKTFVTVIRLDGTKNWLNTHQSNIWVKNELDTEAFSDWLKNLKNDSLPESRSSNKKYILLSSSGEGTCPFSVREVYEGTDGQGKTYDVWFSDYVDDPRPAYLPRLEERDSSYSCCSQERITFNKRPGTSLKLMNNELFVPDNFKILKVSGPDKDDDEGYSDESKNPPIKLGNLIDIQLMIVNNTQPMKVLSDGKDVTVNNQRMSKDSALIHLVGNHGLTEKSARQILNDAYKRGKVECRVKYAANNGPSGDMITGAPGGVSFPEPYIGFDPMTGGNIPTMSMTEHQIPIPDMSAMKTDRNIYRITEPDQRAMQIAQDANQQGQKEIFDTAMLGSMLKAVSQKSMVERYLGDLMKGMDRLGRILFMFYWHGEEFEDRYGKQDMPDLEDGLRNSFESMGDIILTLKRKSIEPYQDEGMDADLEAIANQ